MADNKQKLIKKLLGLDENTNLSIDFRPDPVIYKKTVYDDMGNGLSVALDVSPQWFNAPTIEASFTNRRGY